MKWEYKRILWATASAGFFKDPIKKEEEIQEAITVLGMQGWELVSERNSMFNNYNQVMQVTFTFKRPLE
ncbi:DUF4177 domain-containing protein [Metasolibacillus meyeri]|uniref:DUF4177 domain-containing protein n=1 Tax=Metasolibacillus meyeri TaxID=1071052 RepID=A0AAW9NKB1_9BACL|nr:DUF4177 domain-containing protein [Metasolibacillus meyeri]MEC1177607.1 DUF4177 domain-containing protein [Metasolibacillus meyeri]